MFSMTHSEVLTQLAKNSVRIANVEKGIDNKQLENKKIIPSYSKHIDLNGPDVIQHVLDVFKEAKITLDELNKESQAIFPFLSPNISVKHNLENKEFLKQTIPFDCTALAESKEFSPDIIFIFGNNDLLQTDLVVKHYLALKKTNKEPRLIIVSGRGGHATVSTPLFGITEAETIQQRLIELGVPAKKIIVENKSTNTGLNIKFTENIIPQGSRHIAISSTFSTLFRQLLSIYQQAKHPWETVTILAPTWEETRKHYFMRKKDALIHFIYMLREVATFLDYTINEQFITARVLPNLETLHISMKIMMKYFKLFTGSDCIPEMLIGDFIAALMRKSVGQELTSSIKETLGKQVSEIAHYFRVVFNSIERQWLKQLPFVNPWQHSALLDPEKVFSRYHLDSPRGMKL